MNNVKENKKFSFGYEDTDKKIEIELYGLNFKINDLSSVRELENLDKNDNSVIETELRKILGNDCIERINKKRVNDGYEELNLEIELSILGCILETYANATADKVLGRVTKTINNISEDVNSFKNINREQRRNYNKNNRGYKKYRRY